MKRPVKKLVQCECCLNADTAGVEVGRYIVRHGLPQTVTLCVLCARFIASLGLTVERVEKI